MTNYIRKKKKRNTNRFYSDIYTANTQNKKNKIQTFYKIHRHNEEKVELKQ